MRSALWSALLCGVGMSAAAQQRTVTFEEPSPVAITGFAVGRADYDRVRSEEHTSELQSQSNLVCRLLLEKKKKDSTRSGTGRLQTPYDKSVAVCIPCS